MDRTTETHNKMMRPKAHALLDDLLEEAQKSGSYGHYCIRMHVRAGSIIKVELERLNTHDLSDGKTKDNIGTK